ncbi:MAG: TRAP transporter small permease subunit [Syntrophorhabdales bacterium]|jgi:TRAP-type C4-dicarboxylate transport system permease small subunit
MKKMFDTVKYLSRIMLWIAGLAIASIVVLTVCDVVLRRFRMPIAYTYELVVLLGAIAISFSIPQTTLDKGHVLMDFVTDKLSEEWQKILLFISRCLGIGMFAVFAWRMFILGNNYSRAGEVTPILQIPIYPVAYSVGICFVVECLVLLYGLFSKLGEGEA